MPRIEPVHHGTVINDRHHPLYIDGKQCLGTQEIDARQEPIGCRELRYLRTQVVAECGENALYFMTLGKLQFTQVVVEFYHLGGFEIGSLACRRLVMDKAFDLAAVGVEHRYNQTS